MTKFKKKIWSYIYVIFPWIERRLLFLHEKIRQRYHIGWLAHGKSLEDLKQHLISKWNFHNHFVAWEDRDQVLSLRKLVSFDEQYHLRVYNDGEIKGHYEFTPESKPIRHFLEVGEVEKKEDFLKFLEGYYIP